MRHFSRKIHLPARRPGARDLVLFGALLLAPLLPGAWAVGFDLSWFAVFPGGEEVTGGRYEATAVIGQPVASAPMRSGRYTMMGGFLGPMAPDPTPTPTPTPTVDPSPTPGPTPDRSDYWLAY